MVCEANETAINISIPVVMLPQDAGASLEKSLKNNSSGMLSLILHAFKVSKIFQIFSLIHHCFVVQIVSLIGKYLI